MKAKKLDEFSARKILYSNKNLFKELDYELKSDMEFEEKNEINCQTIGFYRGMPIIAIYIAYKFLYLFVSFFFDVKLGFYGLLKIPALILFFLLFILIKDVKRTINNIFSLRIFICVVHYFDIFLFCKLTTESQVSIPGDINGINIDHFFTLSTYINTYLLIIIVNYIFTLGYKRCITLTLLNNFVFMAFYGHRNCNPFKRLFLNIFSFRFIVSLFYLVLTLLIQTALNRPTKKLWAMFDSFKKSYLSIRNIFNNVTLPIIIVKDDLSEIVFQNPAAIQFCRKYRRIAQKGEYNFKDIFNLENPEDMQLFKDILKISLENNEFHFLFPFYKEEMKKKKNSIHNFDMNLDSGNNFQEKIGFVKIYCFACEWKDKIPCYYFMINENIFTFQGSQVILNDFMLIQMELEKVMWNINTLCLNIDKKLNSKNQNLSLFYIGLSLNFIYDLASTNYIYNTFIQKKKITGYSKFNFSRLVYYLVNYISVFGLNKNFNINVEIDKNEDVICNLTYMRAIFFNILLFIIENTNDPKLKTITIKRENVKYDYKKGNYEKIIFNFTDSRPTLNYETLKYFFQHFNYHLFLVQSPIQTYNLFNLGFLVPCLISETQYNINDPKIKQFNIETKGYQVEVSIIVFFQEISNEESHNIERENIFSFRNAESTINEIRIFLSKKFYVKKETIQEENLLDDGKDDNLIKANEEYNLTEDKNLVNELRAKKYVIGEHHFDDIISEKNKLNNFPKKKIKFKKSNIIKKKDKLSYFENINSISWKNSDFKKFEILRFLVIEEQSYEKESIFNFILKSGNECNLDIASDGNIILEKYKNIFKRRMMYDFIFFDMNQNIIKGTDAINEIRKIESENGIHTKIIGIQNNNTGKNFLGNKINKMINKNLFDEIIPKSMKDFIELIYK